MYTDIEPMLVLSTGNISQETCELASATDWRELHSGLVAPLCIPHEYGFICFVGESSMGVDREDLVVVMDYARKRGATWIMFDRDAEVNTDIPQFDW